MDRKLRGQILFALFNAVASGAIVGFLAFAGGATERGALLAGAVAAAKDTQSLLTSLRKLFGDVGDTQ